MQLSVVEQKIVTLKRRIRLAVRQGETEGQAERRLELKRLRRVAKEMRGGK